MALLFLGLPGAAAARSPAVMQPLFAAVHLQLTGGAGVLCQWSSGLTLVLQACMRMAANHDSSRV